MKKSTIWLLAIIMALTFIGLLYVQIMYMNNMLKMRNEQFSEAVTRSLYAVSHSLELDETQQLLDEYLSINASEEDNPIYQKYTSQTEFSKITSEGVFSIREQTSTVIPSSVSQQITQSSHSNNSLRSYQEERKGRFIYQKGILNDVILNDFILNMLNKSHRPIMERIDIEKLQYYLASEFESYGLYLPFQFAIYSNNDKILYHTAQYDPRIQGNLFSQVLFPNDPQGKVNHLKVYFPTKRDYISSSIKFMIPSFAFTFILLVTFIFTIVIAFRQKKLTEMKNDFINNMTHEFKTPISTISLAAQMLNDPAVAKSPTMFQHISGVINDETKRLRFQVEKVLQMSMFDRQKTLLKLHEVDVNDLVTGVVSTFKLKVEKYGGVIDAELEAEDALVSVDEMHFTNVIFNLLDNAVKYRREEEPLSLFISTRTIGDKVEISIRDNGIGIKQEDVKKIFDKFYRVSTGNRHDVKGFGLGLAYVHKIITDLKGDIRVESKINQGSTFIITLPLIKNE